jgi:uncharacterized protein YlxP (DUF503 family)
MVLRRIKDRLQKLNVAVAEVEHQDLWQRARLGIVAISTTTDHAEEQLRAAADEIDRVEPGVVTRTELEFLTYRTDGTYRRSAFNPQTPNPDSRRFTLTMAQGHRPDRVGDQIRETLSEMLTRGPSRSRHRLHHHHRG